MSLRSVMNRHLTYYDDSVYILNILEDNMLLMKTKTEEETNAASDVIITPLDPEAGSDLTINFKKTESQECNDFQLMIDGA